MGDKYNQNTFYEIFKESINLNLNLQKQGDLGKTFIAACMAGV